jgi:hypothetical protein
MFLRRRLAAFAIVTAAGAVGAPVALASAAAIPATPPVVAGPSCPDGYAGPTNLATGCPYWMMSYTVQYSGQPSFRCPAFVHSAPAVPGVGGGSSGRVLDGCRGFTTGTAASPQRTR